MINELRLSEELVVLAVNKKTGKIAPFKLEYFRYGIAAAILQELLILEKLQLDDEKIKIIDTTPFGDTLLDPALEILDQTDKQKKIQHWVAKLGNKHKKFKNILLTDLMDKGVLRRRQEHNGEDIRRKWFGKDRFNIWYEIPVQHLRKRLDYILLYGKEPDPKSLRLMGLINGCKLTRLVYPRKEDQEKVIPRLNTLTGEDVFKKAIRNTVNTNRASAISSIISGAAMALKEAC